MSDTLAKKPRDELLRIGEAICRGREWRWVALWTYNIHRLFRGRMERREVWDNLDALIRVECDWHKGRELFNQIREVERDKSQAAEYAYLLLGEVSAKSISNASWSPGLFDFNAPWQVPSLAFEIVSQLHDERLEEFLHHHFTSVAMNRYSDKPQKS